MKYSAANSYTYELYIPNFLSHTRNLNLQQTLMIRNRFFRIINLACIATVSLLGVLCGCSDSEKEAKDLFIQSSQDVKNGRSDSAEIKLEQAVELDPEFSQAKLSLGEVKYNKGKFSEAITLFEEALATDSTNYTAHYLLANCYARASNYPKAIENYLAAIKLRPDSLMAFNNLAATYSALNRYDEALGAYQTVIGMLMKSKDAAARTMLATAYFDAANTLGRKGDYAKAVDAYRTTIALKPNFAEAYYYLGITYYKLNDTSNVIEAFKGAIKVKPDFARAYNDLGIIYGKKGDSTLCYNSFGMASVLQGKFAEAMDFFRKALALKPNFTEAQFNLGLAYSYAGDLQNALKTFSAVTVAKPDYLDAYLQLQTLYTQLGDSTNANVAMRKALNLGAKASKKMERNTFRMN